MMTSQDNTKSLEVRKGVPIPKPRHKYPWEDMEVGDHFEVRRPKGSDMETFARQMRVQAYRAGQRYGRVFATRKLDNCMGIWRKS